MFLSVQETIAMSKTKITSKKTLLLSLADATPGTTSYEEAVQGLDEPRMQKVSVTIDRGLLSLVDHFVQHHKGLTRSEIFDQALEMWAKHTQRQADIACYSDNTMTDKQKKAAADWSAIEAEAARYIW